MCRSRSGPSGGILSCRGVGLGSRVEVAAERIKPVVPERAVRRKPGVEIDEGSRFECIDAALRRAGHPNHAGQSEHTQMLRRCRLAETERRHQLANRARLFADEREYGASIRIGQRLPDVVKHEGNMPRTEYAR